MPLIGNKVTEKDIRDYLQTIGYAGRTARVQNLKLAAVERPGWIQVFTFYVEARVPDGDWHEMWGLVRDDDRKQTEIQLFDTEEEQRTHFLHWSKDLITSDRAGERPVATLLVGICVLLLTVATVAAVVTEIESDDGTAPITTPKSETSTPSVMTGVRAEPVRTPLEFVASLPHDGNAFRSAVAPRDRMPL